MDNNRMWLNNSNAAQKTDTSTSALEKETFLGIINKNDLPESRARSAARQINSQTMSRESRGLNNWRVGSKPRIKSWWANFSGKTVSVTKRTNRLNQEEQERTELNDKNRTKHDGKGQHLVVLTNVLQIINRNFPWKQINAKDVLKANSIRCNKLNMLYLETIRVLLPYGSIQGRWLIQWIIDLLLLLK